MTDVVTHDCPDCRCQRRAEIAALSTRLFNRDDGRRSPTGNCWNFEDCLDGFVVHAPECKHVGKGWLSSSDCIKSRYWRGPWPEWAR